MYRPEDVVSPVTRIHESTIDAALKEHDWHSGQPVGVHITCVEALLERYRASGWVVERHDETGMVFFSLPKDTLSLT